MGSMIVTTQRLILVPDNVKDAPKDFISIEHSKDAKYVKRIFVKDYYTGKNSQTDSSEPFEYRIVFRGGGYTNTKNVIEECRAEKEKKSEFDAKYWSQFKKEDDGDPAIFFELQPEIITHEMVSHLCKG